MAQLRLWIFAVQSYGAQVSFDNGDTDEDFDGQPIIVGHQFATDSHQALELMAEELADNMGNVKPEFYDDSEGDEQETEVVEYDEYIDNIKNELQYFELVAGGDHTTLFMS